MSVGEVGDLGRRVAERRGELGLSVEELAVRAGMSPTYVRALESSPAAHPSRAALWALASALQTSVNAISGSGHGGPPGGGAPSGRRELESLDAEACYALIGRGGVGRVVYSADEGPVALPVNFRMQGQAVVFRTAADASVLALPPDAEVSFEVDHLDEALTEGWSVLLTGHVRLVVDPGELDEVRRLGLTPWAGGERPTYVRMVAHRVSGRRIRQRPG